jgi:DNA repair protein RadC
MKKTSQVRSEDAPIYAAQSTAADDDAIIARAIAILESRLRKPGAALTSPANVKDLCTLRMGALEHEVFEVIFLDNRHRVIEFEEMFRGTINTANVHPREVVKRALALNAAAVILAHNHPSGMTDPSDADRRITRQMKEALDLVEIRVLDHVIVGGASSMSFAEAGMI